MTESKFCAWCGSEFTRPANYSNATWAQTRNCSLKCGTRWRWVGESGDRYRKRLGAARRRYNLTHPEENAARVAKAAKTRGVQYPGKSPKRSGRAVAAGILQLDRCVDCGKTNDGPRSLHRHHLDRDPTNNAKSNLVVLCPACHGKRHRGDETRTSNRRTTIRKQDSQDLSSSGG